MNDNAFDLLGSVFCSVPLFYEKLPTTNSSLSLPPPPPLLFTHVARGGARGKYLKRRKIGGPTDKKTGHVKATAEPPFYFILFYLLLLRAALQVPQEKETAVYVGNCVHRIRLCVYRHLRYRTPPKSRLCGVAKFKFLNCGRTRRNQREKCLVHHGRRNTRNQRCPQALFDVLPVLFTLAQPRKKRRNTLLLAGRGNGHSRRARRATCSACDGVCRSGG